MNQVEIPFMNSAKITTTNSSLSDFGFQYPVFFFRDCIVWSFFDQEQFLNFEFFSMIVFNGQNIVEIFLFILSAPSVLDDPTYEAYLYWVCICTVQYPLKSTVVTRAGGITLNKYHT